MERSDGRGVRGEEPEVGTDRVRSSLVDLLSVKIFTWSAGSGDRDVHNEGEGPCVPVSLSSGFPCRQKLVVRHPHEDSKINTTGIGRTPLFPPSVKESW